MAPNTGPTAPGIAPVITFSTGQSDAPAFTGIFSGTGSDWLGSFSGTGQYPCCGNQSTSSWVFSNLNAGFLPSGTFLRLGDVDISESFRLVAYDTNNNQITTGFWLEEPSWVTGGTPSQFVQSNLPSFTWINGVYDFKGSSNNTLLTISFATNTNISRLEVSNEFTNGFGIAAPATVTPEPGTFGMMATVLIGLGYIRKRC